MDRVNWVTHECFHAIAQLSRIGPADRVEPERVHARMRAFVEAVPTRAREAGYPEQEGRLMGFALAALADELVLEQPTGALRERWLREPLARVSFGESTAGEQFFVQLEAARAGSSSDVLRVFYLCLLFGFQGRHRVRGAQVALSDLVDSLRAQLLRSLPMPEVLAPNGPRPEEGALVDSARSVPIVWIGASLVALTIVLYLGLAVGLHDQLAQLAELSPTTGG